MDNTPRKKIVLTGGGTAGHVSPNIALLPYLQEAGYEVTYIGSKKGIEKNLIADFGLPYVGISTGKLRRYFDMKNFTDPFRVVHGYREARKFLKKYKPDIMIHGDDWKTNYLNHIRDEVFEVCRYRCQTCGL